MRNSGTAHCGILGVVEHAHIYKYVHIYIYIYIVFECLVRVHNEYMHMRAAPLPLACSYLLFAVGGATPALCSFGYCAASRPCCGNAHSIMVVKIPLSLLTDTPHYCDAVSMYPWQLAHRACDISLNEAKQATIASSASTVCQTAFFFCSR